MQNVTMLGMDLLDRTTEESLISAKRFLGNSALNVVPYIDYRTLLLADRDELIRDFLMNSAMILWADKEILEIIGCDTNERSQEIADRSFLKELLRYIVDSDSGVALAGKDSESIDALNQELKEIEPELRFVHNTFIDDTGNRIPEDAINGINEHAPAIIISRIDYQKLETWIRQSKPMVNAGIWLAIPEQMSLTGNREKSILNKIRRYIKYLVIKRRMRIDGGAI